MSEHAHKPKPKGVAQAPTKKVAPTSNTRPLGIQRKPTIAPAKSAATAPDQKAGSWVHPSSKPGSHLVGQIFFRTKDSTIDAHDRSLLTGLAHAYAGNKQKAVKGTFEGFADPRPSHHPENTDLSHARAGRIGESMRFSARSPARQQPPNGARTRSGLAAQVGEHTFGRGLTTPRRAEPGIGGETEAQVLSDN